MTPTHQFIFTPGRWLGEGKIAFSTSPDELRFYTSWDILDDANKAIKAFQQVSLFGVEDCIYNKHIFSDITSTTFTISLENEIVGWVQGKGVISEKTIGWEFKGMKEFEGFEIYSLQDNGEYLFHAEYVSDGLFRSITTGRIWKKAE